MPFGTLWGTLWGGGGSGSFYLVRARAVGSQRVRVTFSQAPLFDSPIGRYDAQNLARWSLTRSDTGQVVSLLGTREVDGDPFSVELLLAEPFGPSPLLEYELAANQLHSTTGALLVDPATAELHGMPAIRDVIQEPEPLLDLLNSQTDATRVTGALTVGSSGDYVHEAGDSLIRKLIYRRLLTALDEFYHLAGTGYGAGLVSKKLVRPGDLIPLRRQIELEVSREPEVGEATATLTLAGGKLTIAIQIVASRSSQPFTFVFPVDLTGGSQIG